MPRIRGGSKKRRRSRPPHSKIARFLNSGVMLLRVYAGYRIISLMEKRRGSEWAEKRRRRHNLWSAHKFYDTAIHEQGLLIKTGQFLSSRPDIVPDEYVDVLSELQDEVPPEPFEVIREIVERELGQPLAEIFSEFETEPIAAASLAQVHRAVLLDGRQAAVKVQYPNIERIVAGDLRNLEIFASILKRLDRPLDFGFIAEEMGRMIPKELDFINEGHNAEAIAANFAGVEDITIPEIFWQHTTRRVLTMEYVEGVKITDLEAMERMGVQSADIAKILVVAFSEMLLEHGLFHADPHPGNLLVAPGPKLVLVDFGQVKEVGAPFRLVFAQMTRALVAEDDSELGRSFRDLGFRMKLDTDQGYEDLGNAYVGNISKQMNGSNAGWADQNMFHDSYRDMLRLMRANPVIKIPPDLLFVGRVMGLLNGLSMTLRSPTNLLAEMAWLLDQPKDTTETAKPRRRLLEAGVSRG